MTSAEYVKYMLAICVFISDAGKNDQALQLAENVEECNFFFFFFKYTIFTFHFKK